jgi:hypothetical protein
MGQAATDQTVRIDGDEFDIHGPTQEFMSTVLSIISIAAYFVLLLHGLGHLSWLTSTKKSAQTNAAFAAHFSWQEQPPTEVQSTTKQAVASEFAPPSSSWSTGHGSSEQPPSVFAPPPMFAHDHRPRKHAHTTPH